jgi:hypothetical protein
VSLREPFELLAHIPRYSGVPQKVAVRAPVHTNPSLEIPKSVMQMWPSLVSSKFSGFKSLIWQRQDTVRLTRQVGPQGFVAVPVDHSLLVEILQSQNNLSSVEANSILGEPLFLLEVEKQLACSTLSARQSHSSRATTLSNIPPLM